MRSLSRDNYYKRKKYKKCDHMGCIYQGMDNCHFCVNTGFQLTGVNGNAKFAENKEKSGRTADFPASSATSTNKHKPFSKGHQLDLSAACK